MLRPETYSFTYKQPYFSPIKQNICYRPSLNQNYQTKNTPPRCKAPTPTACIIVAFPFSLFHQNNYHYMNTLMRRPRFKKLVFQLVNCMGQKCNRGSLFPYLPQTNIYRGKCKRLFENKIYRRLDFCERMESTQQGKSMP